jgi:hypothetical protein
MRQWNDVSGCLARHFDTKRLEARGKFTRAIRVGFPLNIQCRSESIKLSSDLEQGVAAVVK